MTLNLRLGGRVGSPRGRGRLTSEVAVGVGGGGVFPETILDLLVTFQTRPDPRPDPDLGPQLHILFRDNPPSTRPHTGECCRAVLGASHISIPCTLTRGPALHTLPVNTYERARSHRYRCRKPRPARDFVCSLGSELHAIHRTHAAMLFFLRKWKLEVAWNRARFRVKMHNQLAHTADVQANAEYEVYRFLPFPVPEIHVGTPANMTPAAVPS